MKVFKPALLLCVLLVPAVTATSQQLPPNAPSRQQVMSLFEAIQLRRTMETAQDAAMQNAMTVVQDMFRQSSGSLDAETKRQMDIVMKGVMEDVRSVLSVDEMLEAVVPIYQRHYTVDEVNAIIAFQNSPVGRKMVSLQPIMVQESYQALGPMQQRAMPELMRRLDERLKKLEPSSSNASKQPNPQHRN